MRLVASVLAALGVVAGGIGIHVQYWPLIAVSLLAVGFAIFMWKLSPRLASPAEPSPDRGA